MCAGYLIPRGLVLIKFFFSFFRENKQTNKETNQRLSICHKMGMAVDEKENV